MKNKKIPPIIIDQVKQLQQKYADSPSTTNAGIVLRIVARFVTLDMVLKLLTRKRV